MKLVVVQFCILLFYEIIYKRANSFSLLRFPLPVHFRGKDFRNGHRFRHARFQANRVSVVRFLCFVKLFTEFFVGKRNQFYLFESEVSDQFFVVENLSSAFFPTCYTSQFQERLRNLRSCGSSFTSSTRK
jgi:hypothetical protein